MKLSINRLYEVGDLIMAKMEDINPLGEIFYHIIKGHISYKFFHKDELVGYNVKLLKEIEFDTIIPLPKSEIKHKSHQNNEKFLKCTEIYVPKNLIIQGLTLSKHKTEIKTNYTLLEVLRVFWSELIFRSIKTIINDDSVFYNKNKEINDKKSIRVPYNNIGNYYGFTNSSMINDNDNYHNVEFFFSKKCFNGIDLNINPVPYFSMKNKISNTLPHTNQLICGIPEYGEKGMFFRKWFIPSPQFCLMWSTIMKHNTLDNNELKNKYFELKDMPTNSKRNIYIELLFYLYSNHQDNIHNGLMLSIRPTFFDEFLSNCLWMNY